jgi:hypothetical protein
LLQAVQWSRRTLPDMRAGAARFRSGVHP